MREGKIVEQRNNAITRIEKSGKKDVKRRLKRICFIF